MNATVVVLVVVALAVSIVWPERVEEPPRLVERGHGRWLAGLVDVDYDGELLVSPRGVELPYCSGWDLDDVMDTLAEVDAL